MIPTLEGLLYRQDAQLAVGSLDFLKLHNGYGYRNPKVSFIAFADRRPYLFLKSVRFPTDNRIIERAHASLAAANEAVKRSGAVAHIPATRWIGFAGEMCVSAESVLDGRPLLKTSEKEVGVALSWLDAFAKGNTKPALSVRDLQDLLERLLREMKASDIEFLKYTQELFVRLISIAGGNAFELLTVPAHGDYTPSNIVIDGSGNLGVIDWDRYGDIVIPLFDVLTFLERIAPKNSNIFVFGKPIIERYVESLGISARSIPLLIFFYIVLSDWRKRERMFAWEPAKWDRDTLNLMRVMMADAKKVFAW